MARGEKRNVLLAAIVILLILLLGTVGSYLAWRPANNADQRGDALNAGSATQPANTIKVGWMVSEWTADEHPYGAKGSWDSVTAIRPRLIDPQIELFAIVEPETRSSATVAPILRKYFKADHVVDGADAAALSKLDVIVCSRDWNMRAPVSEAILKAVSSGTGLLRHLATGIFHADGGDEDIEKINCMDDPKFFWNREPITCYVVSDHPLLAGVRASLPGGKIEIANLNGCIGVVHGTPLIVAEDGAQSSHGIVADGLPTTGPTTAPAPTDRRIFAPMFVGQIGKGKVVACQWDSIPRPLYDATRGRFYIHCVQWLANRPIE